MTKRFCPLCDQDWEATTCPLHAVPTIGPAEGSPARLEVGTVLVRQYRIDGLLGQGGMGALLSATDLRDGQRVVVKVLRGERVGEVSNVRRFYQEARAASSLSHPNIVRILMFGVDETTRAPFLAMEHVPGRTLKDRVAAHGPWGEHAASAVFVAIARALAAAHRAHVLHRDLKPSNIMVEWTELGPKVKVLDFGLAKILEDPSTVPLTQPGKTVGTPAFMSPEQVTQRPQDFRTDLYGLGCVLHAALTGAPPFTGADLVEVMRKQMRSPAPPLPPVLADGRPPSEALRRLHAQLLAKAPDHRPASTEAVVKALLDIQGHFTSPTASAPQRGFEPIRTTVDHEPAPTAAGSSPALAGPTTASMFGEEPTMAHRVRGGGLQGDPTDRMALEDLPRPNAEIEDAPTPRLPSSTGGFEDPGASTEVDEDESEPSLTSVLPASLDHRELADTVTPALRPVRPEPSSESEPVPVELSLRGVERPRVGGPAADPSPRRWMTPAPANPAPRRSLGWLLGICATGAGLFVGVALTLTPAPARRIPIPANVLRPSVIATPREAPVVTNMIEIRSRPPGAEVVLNGDPVGRTPIALARPAASAAHQLLIRRRGYRSMAVRIDRLTASPVSVELQPR